MHNNRLLDSNPSRVFFLEITMNHYDLLHNVITTSRSTKKGLLKTIILDTRFFFIHESNTDFYKHK